MRRVNRWTWRDAGIKLKYGVAIITVDQQKRYLHQELRKEHRTFLLTLWIGERNISVQKSVDANNILELPVSKGITKNLSSPMTATWLDWIL